MLVRVVFFFVAFLIDLSAQATIFRAADTPIAPPEFWFQLTDVYADERADVFVDWRSAGGSLLAEGGIEGGLVPELRLSQIVIDISGYSFSTQLAGESALVSFSTFKVVFSGSPLATSLIDPRFGPEAVVIAAGEVTRRGITDGFSYISANARFTDEHTLVYPVNPESFEIASPRTTGFNVTQAFDAPVVWNGDGRPVRLSTPLDFGTERFVPVPEPSLAVLLGLGLAVLAHQSRES